MSEVLTAVAIVLVFFAVIAALALYALFKVARTARDQARKVRTRVARNLPAAAFGNQLWWLVSRVDQVTEQADYAVRAASGTAFESDVSELAAELDHGCAVVTHRIRALAPLVGPQRAHEIERLEPHIEELERGGAALVDMAVMAAERHSFRNNETPGEAVRRRAEAYIHALRELTIVEEDSLHGPGAALPPPTVETGWVPPREAEKPEQVRRKHG